MEHQVLYRRDGYYSGFPHIDQLRDGRLAVRLTSSLHGDHYRVGLTGKKIVLVSDDEGRSWAESDDPSVPYNWAGGFGYEHSDSFAAVMADGTYVSAGVIRWEIWPVERSREAANQGFEFDPHLEDEGSIVVGVNKAFARRSTDQGQTWASRYWRIPGFGVATDFSRCAVLEDGTILVPVYGNDVAGNPQSFVWRSGDSGVSVAAHLDRPARFRRSHRRDRLCRGVARACLGPFEERDRLLLRGLVGRRRVDVVAPSAHGHLGAVLPCPPAEATRRENTVHIRVAPRADGDKGGAKRR